MTYRDQVDTINGTMRNKVFAIEREMNEVPKGAMIDPQPIDKAEMFANIELITNHFFSEGLYAREIRIPKYAIVVGKIHKYKSLNVLLKGELSVFIDGKIEKVKAPIITVAQPGMKRIAYAHEDSIWLTIHRTDEMDLSKIEDHFIAQSEQEWLEFCKQEPQLPLEGDQKCLI